MNIISYTVVLGWLDTFLVKGVLTHMHNKIVDIQKSGQNTGFVCGGTVLRLKVVIVTISLLMTEVDDIIGVYYNLKISVT